MARRVTLPPEPPLRRTRVTTAGIPVKKTPLIRPTKPKSAEKLPVVKVRVRKAEPLGQQLPQLREPPIPAPAKIKVRKLPSIRTTETEAELSAAAAATMRAAGGQEAARLTGPRKLGPRASRLLP